MSQLWGEKMIINLAETGGGKPKISYTGTHITSNITTGGVAYTMYTITGSGTLTVKGKAKNARVWLCGGGANGEKAGDGGAGAYCAQLDSADLKGDYAVTVGAAQGATSFGSLLSVTAVSSRDGGTGGGGTASYSPGKGDGVAKYPFGDTSLYCHCAGGGAGKGEVITGKESDYNYYVSSIYGYDGGSNGGNGSTYSGDCAGGTRGGGNGGNEAAGSAATFYGSGGGGGGCDHYSIMVDPGYANRYYDGGSGYQGIVYLLIPTE